MALVLKDRVALSSHFLRSIGENPTSPRWGDRGEIVGFECADIFANIRWDDGRETMVNVANLRAVQNGAGLNEETPAHLGNAWVGMGFQSLQGETS